jgi:hypothetical protein
LTNHGTTLIRFAFQKVEKIAAGMLVQRDSVLVFPVQLCHGVLVDVLRECNGTKGLEIIRVYWLEVRTDVSEESLRIFSVGMLDKFQERIDEDGPQQLGQFELELSAKETEGVWPWHTLYMSKLFSTHSRRSPKARWYFFGPRLAS